MATVDWIHGEQCYSRLAENKIGHGTKEHETYRNETEILVEPEQTSKMVPSLNWQRSYQSPGLMFGSLLTATAPDTDGVVQT